MATSAKNNTPTVTDLLEARRKQKEAAVFIPPHIPGLLPNPGESLKDAEVAAKQAHKVSVANAEILAEAARMQILNSAASVSPMQAAANARAARSNEFTQVFFGPIGANITFKDGSTGKFGEDGFYISQSLTQFVELKTMFGVVLATPEMIAGS